MKNLVADCVNCLTRRVSAPQLLIIATCIYVIFVITLLVHNPGDSGSSAPKRRHSTATRNGVQREQQHPDSLSSSSAGLGNFLQQKQVEVNDVDTPHFARPDCTATRYVYLVVPVADTSDLDNFCGTVSAALADRALRGNSQREQQQEQHAEDDHESEDGVVQVAENQDSAFVAFADPTECVDAANPLQCGWLHRRVKKEGKNERRVFQKTRGSRRRQLSPDGVRESTISATGAGAWLPPISVKLFIAVATQDDAFFAHVQQILHTVSVTPDSDLSKNCPALRVVETFSDEKTVPGRPPSGNKTARATWSQEKEQQQQFDGRPVWQSADLVSLVSVSVIRSASENSQQQQQKKRTKQEGAASGGSADIDAAVSVGLYRALRAARESSDALTGSTSNSIDDSGGGPAAKRAKGVLRLRAQTHFVASIRPHLLPTSPGMLRVMLDTIIRSGDITPSRPAALHNVPIGMTARYPCTVPPFSHFSAAAAAVDPGAAKREALERFASKTVGVSCVGLVTDGSKMEREEARRGGHVSNSNEKTRNKNINQQSHGAVDDQGGDNGGDDDDDDEHVLFGVTSATAPVINVAPLRFRSSSETATSQQKLVSVELRRTLARQRLLLVHPSRNSASSSNHSRHRSTSFSTLRLNREQVLQGVDTLLGSCFMVDAAALETAIASEEGATTPGAPDVSEAAWLERFTQVMLPAGAAPVHTRRTDAKMEPLVNAERRVLFIYDVASRLNLTVDAMRTFRAVLGDGQNGRNGAAATGGGGGGGGDASADDMEHRRTWFTFFDSKGSVRELLKRADAAVVEVGLSKHVAYLSDGGWWLSIPTSNQTTQFRTGAYYRCRIGAGTFTSLVHCWGTLLGVRLQDAETIARSQLPAPHTTVREHEKRIASAVGLLDAIIASPAHNDPRAAFMTLDIDALEPAVELLNAALEESLSRYQNLASKLKGVVVPASASAVRLDMSIAALSLSMREQLRCRFATAMLARAADLSNQRSRASLVRAVSRGNNNSNNSNAFLHHHAVELPERNRWSVRLLEQQEQHQKQHHHTPVKKWEQRRHSLSSMPFSIVVPAGHPLRSYLLNVEELRARLLEKSNSIMVPFWIDVSGATVCEAERHIGSVVGPLAGVAPWTVSPMNAYSDDSRFTSIEPPTSGTLTPLSKIGGGRTHLQLGTSASARRQQREMFLGGGDGGDFLKVKRRVYGNRDLVDDSSAAAEAFASSSNSRAQCVHPTGFSYLHASSVPAHLYPLTSARTHTITFLTGHPDVLATQLSVHASLLQAFVPFSLSWILGRAANSAVLLSGMEQYRLSHGTIRFALCFTHWCSEMVNRYADDTRAIFRVAYPFVPASVFDPLEATTLFRRPRVALNSTSSSSSSSTIDDVLLPGGVTFTRAGRKKLAQLGSVCTVPDVENPSCGQKSHDNREGDDEGDDPFIIGAPIPWEKDHATRALESLSRLVRVARSVRRIHRCRVQVVVLLLHAPPMSVIESAVQEALQPLQPSPLSSEADQANGEADSAAATDIDDFVSTTMTAQQQQQQQQQLQQWRNGSPSLISVCVYTTGAEPNAEGGGSGAAAAAAVDWTDHDTADFLTSSSVVVHPLNPTGYPHLALQSMLVGRPLIMPLCCGLQEMALPHEAFFADIVGADIEHRRLVNSVGEDIIVRHWTFHVNLTQVRDYIEMLQARSFLRWVVARRGHAQAVRRAAGADSHNVFRTMRFVAGQIEGVVIDAVKAAAEKSHVEVSEETIRRVLQMQDDRYQLA